MNLTNEEMFAIEAVEYGVQLDDLAIDLALHFDFEVDNVDVVVQNEWNLNENGLYYPYTVNGITCVCWDMNTHFILEYGNAVYTVDRGNVYNSNELVGTLTEEGDISFREQC